MKPMDVVMDGAGALPHPRSAGLRYVRLSLPGAELSGVVYFICQWPLNSGNGGFVFPLTINRFAALFFILGCSGGVVLMGHGVKWLETAFSRMLTASCIKRTTFVIGWEK